MGLGERGNVGMRKSVNGGGGGLLLEKVSRTKAVV